MSYDERELKRTLMKIETLLVDIYDDRGIQKKVCPVCESEVRLFTPHGEKLRPNAKCPVCGSLERTRAWWLYYNKIGLLKGIDKKIKLLHFAPEEPFWNAFNRNSNIDYYPVDYNPDYKGIRDVVDITAIPYEDEMFDIIMCNHVLEHIEDEKKALRECYRVLKADGVLFLTVPFYANEQTLENAEYNTDELRSKYYGQCDHVRRYGFDTKVRLQEIFMVEEIDCIKALDFDEKQIIHYGLSQSDVLWRLTKAK